MAMVKERHSGHSKKSRFVTSFHQFPSEDNSCSNGIVLTLRSPAQHVQRQASHDSTQRQDLLFVHYFGVPLPSEDRLLPIIMWHQ